MKGQITLPARLILFIIASIALFIFYLLVMTYTAKETTTITFAPHGAYANYIADALVSLPYWDGECGCLATSVNTQDGLVIYPALVNATRLGIMNSGCKGPSNIEGKIVCVNPFPGVWVKSLEETTSIEEALGEDAWGMQITDLENGSSWEIWASSWGTYSAFGTMDDTKKGVKEKGGLATRIVAIEYPDSAIHAGELKVWARARRLKFY